MFSFIDELFDSLEDFIEDAAEFIIDLFDTDDDILDDDDDDFDNPLDAPAYENFDPDSATDVVGDPESFIDNWHMQETDTSCAVASQQFIIEELLNVDLDEGELRDIAEEMGWYDPNGGTPADDVGNLLEYMGLDVIKSTGNTLEDLEESLADGHEIVVSVDSSEVWCGEDDDFFFPGMDADHAIQVIGIDFSNPDSPMVIVNDSGCANGAGALIPADVFMSSWEDGGCLMVEVI